MIKYLTDNASALFEKTLEHLYISVFALLIAIIIAIPLGILLSKTDKLSKISYITNDSNFSNLGTYDSFIWCR